MNRKSSDLILVIAITSAAIAVALLGVEDMMVRAIVILPFVLILPGYAITAGMFPAHVFGITERLLFSLGLSLSVIALGGLLLNMTPWGLQTGSWTIFLAIIILSCSAYALIRRCTLLSSTTKLLSIGLNIRQGLLLGLATLVFATAIGVANVAITQQPTPGTAQLWLVPATPNDQSTVRLGINNMEHVTTSYLLRLTVAGRNIREWKSLTLAPGEVWESTVVLPKEALTAGSTEAILYREDNPEAIYRRVMLWQGQ